MSYQNAINKMRKLENKGLLDYGDNSTPYTQDNNIYYRFIKGGENKEYVTKKIKEVLIKEKVLFSARYSLIIIPHDHIMNIILNAKSVNEMVTQLNKLDFVKAFERDNHACVRFVAIGGGETEEIYSYGIIEAMQETFKDHKEIEISKSNGYRGFYITSKKFTKENNKKVIDDIFANL